MAKREIELIPRGSLSQNTFAQRSSTAGSLGAHPEVEPTAAAAVAVAVRIVRKNDPEFEPAFDSQLVS